MGCEVVSVYNDQVLGKVGLPQSIINDLIDRDYRQIKLLQKHKTLSNKIRHIYGYTQSHAISEIFFTFVAEKEYIVYPAGRFIVMEDTKTKEQILMTNPDFISAFTIHEKLCLVGLIGGIILLWDLQFKEIKLQILLPEQSTVVSTVGLTSKYVFATDSCTPNNNIFCFDLRTAKRKGHKVISSFEPALRSITIGQNMHVTACADGLWFNKMNKEDKDIEVMKGMFGRYPKTSMTCLGKVGDFVISGGVDGYVYVWRIKTMKCCRALKVNDNQIISIGVKNKHIIFGCMTGPIKIYTFEVTKKEKAQFVFEVKEDEDDNQQDLAFIVVDAFSREEQTIAIATSVADPLLFYCMTKEGLIYQKWLPAPIADRRMMNTKLNMSQTIQKINTTGSVVLQGDRMYSAYKGGKNILLVDIYSLVNNQLRLMQERVALLKDDCMQKHISYSIKTEEISYLTISNKVQVSLTFNKITQSVAHQNKSDFGVNCLNIQQIQNEELLLIQYSQEPKQLLFVTTSQTIWVYERTTKLHYEEQHHIKFQSKLPESIKVDQRQYSFDKDIQRWVSKNNQIQSISSEKQQYHKLIHNASVQSLEEKWASNKASVGGGMMILWNQY